MQRRIGNLKKSTLNKTAIIVKDQRAIQEKNMWILEQVKKGTSKEVLAERLHVSPAAIQELVEKLKQAVSGSEVARRKLTLEILKTEYLKGHNCAEITRLHPGSVYSANFKIYSTLVDQLGIDAQLQHGEARKRLVEEGKLFVKGGKTRRKLPLPDMRGVAVTPESVSQLFCKGLGMMDISRAFGGVDYIKINKIVNELLFSKDGQRLLDANAKARAEFFGVANVSSKAKAPLNPERSMEILKAATLEKKEVKFAKPTPKGIAWAEKRAIQIANEIKQLEHNSTSVSQNLIAREANRDEISKKLLLKKELMDYMGGWLPESEVERVFADYVNGK